MNVGNYLDDPNDLSGIPDPAPTSVEAPEATGPNRIVTNLPFVPITGGPLVVSVDPTLVAPIVGGPGMVSSGVASVDDPASPNWMPVSAQPIFGRPEPLAPASLSTVAPTPTPASISGFGLLAIGAILYFLLK